MYGPWLRKISKWSGIFRAQVFNSGASAGPVVVKSSLVHAAVISSVLDLSMAVAGTLARQGSCRGGPADMEAESGNLKKIRKEA